MKRFLSLLLVFALVLSCTPAMPIQVQAATGEQSAVEGYTPVSNKEELDAIRNDLSGKYYLTADIVFTEADYLYGGSFYNDGKGWIPIGSNSNPFTGILDGNGHSIIGLYAGQYEYAGLFAYFSGTVQNLTLKDAKIQGNLISGAIAGQTNDAALLRNCTVDGIVQANRGAGGLVGRCYGSWNSRGVVEFENCHNYATVIATADDAWAGGVYGDSSVFDIVVHQSSNHGDITAEDTAGGIAATLSVNGSITESYNIGNISVIAGTNQANGAGGIAGSTETNTLISNCYNTGLIKATNSINDYSYGYLGGIAGWLSDDGIKNCYNIGDLMVNDRYGDNTTSQATGWHHMYGIACSGLSNCYTIAPYYMYRGNYSKAKMQQKATYKDFDFEGIWFFDAETDYPYPQLRNNVQASIESIEIELQPIANTFIEGRRPDLSGATAKIIYKSGKVTTVDITENMLADIDYCKPGVQQVHIYYAGMLSENTVNFQVISKNIELTSLPTKTTYLENKDILDLTGAKITVTYGDGTTEVLDVTADMVTGFNNSVVGVQTLTVCYEEKKVNFDIEVYPKSLKAIRVSTLPLKLTYVQGQPLEFDGGVLELLYDNDQTEKKALTVAEMHIDPNALGITPVTVSYGGVITSYDVTVNEQVITGLQVIAPQKVNYYQGDNLDLSGCKLIVAYESDDKYSEEVVVSSDMISGYDMNTPGLQTVVVGYNGYSATFEIEVLPNIVEKIEIVSLPNTLRYQLQVGILDLAGGILRVTYSNGEMAEIVMSEARVNGFNNAQAGTQTLTVIYAGQETTFDIEIVRREPSKITILNMPKKIEYLHFLDELDLTGGVIQVDYTIGSSENFPLSAADISGFDSSSVGTKILTVTVGNAQATFEIYVVANNTTEFAGGAGTEEHPYLISTKTHLNNVRNYLDAHYLMLNDISISNDDYQESGIFYNNGSGWLPIGAEKVFNGVFNGGGFGIDNLLINIEDGGITSVGLFAINSGTIKNLTIKSGTISVHEKSSNINIGAIAGINKGNIDNCSNQCSITATHTKFNYVIRIGGIVGYNYANLSTATITECTNKGNISGYGLESSDDIYVGGIAGESYADGSNAAVIIDKCYNSGTIFSGADYAYSGGIVGENGQNYSQNAIIRNCGNSGCIIAGLKYDSQGSAGGIAGFNGGYISQCYNTANVEAYLTTGFGSAYAGGIAGQNRSPNKNAVNTIENCFNTGNVSAFKKNGWSYGAAYAGGISGNQAMSTNYPGKVICCYSTGIANCNMGDGSFGAITPEEGGGTVQTAYHLNNMQATFEGETSCSQAEMMQKETFIGFDFTNVWTMDGNSNYPYPELRGTPLEEKAVSVEIVRVPDKQTYYVGEEYLDLTGGKISVTYNTMRTEIITMTSDMVSDFNNSEAGKQVVAISIDNLAVTFEIIIKYATITFLNEDGTILQENMYAYGDKVTAPADPTKAADKTYTYTFAGWDKEVVDCAGDATYTATYTKEYINYTVVFKNWDGIVLSTKTYHYGDAVIVPANPTKAADSTYTYTFAGWDNAVVNCTGNATYTATYTPTYINYTIVFKNWNGTVLSTKTYHYGDNVIVPADPSKSADNTYTYIFAGWDKEIVNCAGDATYTATYTPTYINYTVEFEDWNGKVISSNTYHWGDTVTVPGNPTKAADNTYTYTFAGWDKDVVNCAGDVTYMAQYTANYINYTVMFKNWDGTVLFFDTYHWGNKVIAPADPIKAADNTYTYTFKGWDKEIVNCAGDAVYTATYTPVYIDYTVAFKNWNGTILSIQTYHYGDAVTAPAAPVRPNDDRYEYTFTGWDKDVANCTGNVTYTAVYASKLLVPTTITSNKHTVSGGVISKVGVGTTAESLISNINESKFAKIYKGATEVTGTALIGTGMEVKLTDGTVVGTTATVIVTGDTNGDGKINITDMLAVKAHLLKKSELEGASALAGDTSGDSKINITDFIQIKAHILGKEQVKPQSIVTNSVVQTAAFTEDVETMTLVAETSETPAANLYYLSTYAMAPDKRNLFAL